MMRSSTFQRFGASEDGIDLTYDSVEGALQICYKIERWLLQMKCCICLLVSVFMKLELVVSHLTVKVLVV